MEIRSFNEVANVQDNVIEGYSIVFNRESEMLYDPKNKRFFIEVISPEAVNQELIQRSDIKMLIDHSKSQMLARSRYGEGSLELSIDDYGLKFRFEIPDTNQGQFIKEMVKRGDYQGCSFAFTDGKNIEYKYDREREVVVRTVRSIDKLFDCSIVADPAYSDTEVSVREIEDNIPKEEEKVEEQDDTWKEHLNQYKERLNRL